VIYIPEGEFIMGSGPDENYDEQPQRKVFLDGYYIDTYQVTNAKYKEFVDATGYKVPYIKKPWAEKYNWKDDTYPRGTENKPVVLVDWFDACEYAKWAGKRLPTEAEWEKAARGTDGRIWPWGDTWVREKAACKQGGSLMDVGRFEKGKSVFGCYDMAGNVWEWAQDWYREDYYQQSSGLTNPKGPDEGEYRVLRGGSWIHEKGSCRCAKRYFRRPHYADNYIGFRCAKDA
jgi:formylglycine-generating enzyme required for sulfatase activity